MSDDTAPDAPRGPHAPSPRKPRDGYWQFINLSGKNELVDSDNLIVLLTKLDLNSRCVFCKPLPHLVVRPRPLHGAGITMIVFWP